MLSTYDKAKMLLSRLYKMNRRGFTLLSAEDIMAKATPEEIDFYYHHICEKENERCAIYVTRIRADLNALTSRTNP
jgi:hypothetical protein